MTLRLLIVDDHELMREFIGAVASTDPIFEVCGTASDGRRAIELADELKPDVVILDSQMPGLNGLDALPELLQVAPEAHVVMFSGSEELEFEKAARDSGASDYFVKGVDDVEKVLDAAKRYAAPEAGHNP